MSNLFLVPVKAEDKNFSWLLVTILAEITEVCEVDIKIVIHLMKHVTANTKSLFFFHCPKESIAALHW